MKKSLHQRREEFLSGTLKYYTKDINRRCVSENETCFYSPLSADKVGQTDGCAIGRWLKPELQLRLDNCTKNIVSVDDIFNQLPTVLKNLGQNFLSSCQGLHDSSANWEKKGLSVEGRYTVSEIIKIYDLNPDKFSKWLTKNI